jgi:threonine synthase
VSDGEIIEAQKLIARLEGVGVEPASAASIAGLRKLTRQGEVSRDELVVCVATGHILKDPEEAMGVSEPPMTVRAEVKSLERLR